MLTHQSNVNLYIKKTTLFKYFKYNLIMGTETKQEANPKAIGLPEPKFKDNLSQPGVFYASIYANIYVDWRIWNL